jgi:hypothetical protein
MDFIEAFFDVLNDKVLFLRQLFDSQRQDEAMTLCCVYIDGLGQALYFPEDRSAFNFVRALREHGEQPYLDLVHPAGLVRWVKTQEPDRKKFRGLSAKIDSAMAPFKGKLVSEAELQQALSQGLSHSELQVISPELWRGTLAHVAYNRLRNPFVHTLRGYCGVLFDQITYDGQPVPEIDFSMLHSALESLARHAHEISVKSGKFCGHR